VARESDGYAENEHSYASPVIWHKGDEAYLITHGNDYSIAHRLSDGKEIWRVTELNAKSRYNPTLRFVASPAATPDLIVVPSAKLGPVVGVKPNASGAIKPGSEYEQWRIPKNTPDVACPLVHDGLVYLCYEARGVFLLCLDAKTGKEVYNEQLYNNRVRHRASPVYADGKIYVLARDGGTMKVVKAGPKFELLATNTLPDTFAASPAIADGRIYLRGYKTLYAIAAISTAALKFGGWFPCGWVKPGETLPRGHLLGAGAAPSVRWAALGKSQYRGERSVVSQFHFNREDSYSFLTTDSPPPGRGLLSKRVLRDSVETRSVLLDKALPADRVPQFQVVFDANKDNVVLQTRKLHQVLGDQNATVPINVHLLSLSKVQAAIDSNFRIRGRRCRESRCHPFQLGLRVEPKTLVRTGRHKQGAGLAERFADAFW
jgi:outer membrane protein assembly factor BamB